MCRCFIVPGDVLQRLADELNLSAEAKQALRLSAILDGHIRQLREQVQKLTATKAALSPVKVTVAPEPAVTVYNCHGSQTLPGRPVQNPDTAGDADSQQIFQVTTSVAQFYKQVFGRNSIDDAGMTMMSSEHYGHQYNNAMWNGQQMVYGDGDGQIFIDFCKGNDVVGHELTHGVTQYTLQLDYSGDAGGLNEGNSDVFGSMFRQWSAGQDVSQADWLIGSDILGAAAKEKGYTCLRNMANPADTTALAPQPVNYSGVTPDMDPHYSSGVPNFAFYKMCMSIGGKSWEKAGQIWYQALTGLGPQPNLTMQAFADKMRALAQSLYPDDANIASAVNQAWADVGLPAGAAPVAANVRAVPVSA
jgi:Zn-dependent metalloprotease